MKKLFIVFLSVLFLFSCKSEGIETVSLSNDENYIPLNESFRIADSLHPFITGNNIKRVSKSNTNSGKPSLKKEVLSDDGTTVMRVFNYENGGFVILAADRRANPILAYSDETGFPSDTIPPAAEAWLYENKLQIEELRAQGTKEILKGDRLLKETKYVKLLSGNASSVVVKKTATDKIAKPYPPVGECEGTSFVVGPLLQTTWDQSGGYNNLMPSSTCTPFYCNNRAYTGCVATAMAQVMRYHQYPTKYNYSIMPNSVTSYLDMSAGANELSRLMRDAAVAVDSKYDCNGTGAAANLNDIPYALENTFGYSVTATATDFNYNTVVNEIQYNRPVILSGYKEKSGFIFHTFKGGHVWVVDGIRGGTSCPERMPDGTLVGGASFLWFHMNWGWGGSNNGWFGFASANAGNGSNYQYKRGMVYSIKK